MSDETKDDKVVSMRVLKGGKSEEKNGDVSEDKQQLLDLIDALREMAETDQIISLLGVCLMAEGTGNSNLTVMSESTFDRVYEVLGGIEQAKMVLFEGIRSINEEMSED